MNLGGAYMVDFNVLLAQAFTNTRELPAPCWLPKVEAYDQVLPERLPPWAQAFILLMEEHRLRCVLEGLDKSFLAPRAVSVQIATQLHYADNRFLGLPMPTIKKAADGSWALVG